MAQIICFQKTIVFDAINGTGTLCMEQAKEFFS